MKVVSKELLNGVIIGQCVGDALGFPVEGSGPKQCDKFVVKYLDNLRTDIELQTFEFGQYTDDSQLARELLLSLRKNRGWNPSDYADRIAELFSTNQIVGRGIATNHAVTRLIQGKKWDEAGVEPPSAGNGTAMRASPVGIFFHDNESELVRIAKEQGIITHLDKRTQAGSVIIADTVAYLLQNNLDIEELIERLTKKVRTISPIFSQELFNLPKWLELDYEEAVKQIGKSGEPDINDNWKYISPYVIPSVLWSLYSFLQSPENYMNSIKLAIRCGGDVDTTGAMTGAISGAYNGINSIPDVYTNIIHDRGEWKKEDISEVIDDIMPYIKQ